MSLNYDFDAADLDEFLVEYVDGTMDPVVREAFEEFLRVYPEVADQVDCLATVRSQLCRLGDKCRCHAPPGFQDRLKEHLLEESSRETVISPSSWLPHLNGVAIAFSLTLLALAIGMTVSSSTSESEEPAVTEIVDDSRMETDSREMSGSTAEQVLDVSRSVTVSRDGLWSVSHTHPGSGEIHVEAAFDRPILLSVRRDLVTMRPISNRPAVVYTLP